ncbi:hypothetical protein [Thiofilum flexile]|uniref:hypothetical protein n=1 Tax=Thiofilum flexile TaxID=125627 RepID=UPI0003612078|nr:hypothetical protein [Thiofilum flexile]
MKQLTLITILVTFILLLSASSPANAITISEEARQLIPSKGTTSTTDKQPLEKELTDKIQSDLRQLRETGVITVKNDEVVDQFTIDAYKKFMIPISDALPNLTFTPATISYHEIQNKELELKGVVLKSEITTGELKEKWAGIEKFFLLENKSVLSIEEIDYPSTGGNISFHESFINESVNGHPAIFLVKKSSKGAALSKLSWFTENRLFTISMSGHVKGRGRANKLVALAESIY